ncbi:MAG TPA: hypothetical protein VH560_00280 [Polyangia bacterium]|jgi:hypothetical protein|nr:hypothetical protein [Polyangia bacterium]
MALHGYTVHVVFADGRTATYDVELRTGAQVDVATQAPADAPVGAAAPVVVASQNDGPSRRTIGFVVLGGATAVVITGVVVGAIGLGQRNAFDDSASF